MKAIYLAIGFAVATALIVFLFAEPTTATETGHFVFSISYAGWPYLVAAAIFWVLKLTKGGSISGRFVRNGVTFSILSGILFLVALNANVF